MLFIYTISLVTLISLFLLFKYLNYLLYFFLLPILLSYNNSNIDQIYKFYYNFFITNNIYEKTNITYLNSFEINLPFYITDFFYLKFLFIFFLFLALPILIYIIYTVKFSFLFSYENKKENLINKIQIISYFILNVLVYTFILPLILFWFFKHYTNFLLFEFDIQFNLILFIKLYIKLFCINTLYIYLHKYIKQMPFYFILFILYLIINISDTILIIIISFLYYFIYKIIIYTYGLFYFYLINFYNSICNRKCNI
jgi:hypothetical protein